MQARLRDQLRRHPRAVTAVVAGGSVVLLAVAVGLAIAVFRGALPTGDASGLPSASAITSASPTFEASPSSTPPEPMPSLIPYAADDPLLQVSVDGLRMRATASITADIVRSLGRGEVVRVVSGPVDAGGYVWHEVVDLDSRIGWVAMGSGGAPWLEVVPAEPSTSGLLLRLERNCDVSFREISPNVVPADVALTADGRVVLIGGVVRKLSPSGQAQIQRDVLELAALQASATYNLEPQPGAPEAPGHGLCVNYFTLGEGADRLVVTAVGWQGDAEEASYWLLSPERRDLDKLAIHLLDVEAWLGPAAWSEPTALRYVSSSYQFWLELPTNTAPPPEVNAPLVTGTAWPFDGPIEQFGEVVGEARCGYLDPGQAFETLRLMRSLRVDPSAASVDPPRELALDGFGYGNFTTDAGWFGFWLTPRSPDGYPSCSD